MAMVVVGKMKSLFFLWYLFHGDVVREGVGQL